MNESDLKNLLIVISSPSGGGKTTLRNRLLEIFPNLHYSISCTTRKPRSGEIEGKDYHFISQKDFESKLKNEEFVEYAKVYDYFYGTPLSEIDVPIKEGKDVLLDVDTQGALAIRGKREAVLIFILPPSLEILKGRLYNRKTDTENEIGKRLREAYREFQMANRYDYLVINDHLEHTVEKIKSIILAEKHKIHRQDHLIQILNDWMAEDAHHEKKSS